MRSAVTKGGGLTLLRPACVNDAGAKLGSKTPERTSTWMPVGPAGSCCRLTSRSTAQIPVIEQLFTPAPCDMSWQCAIAGCWAHCTAQTEDAAWETSSASNTAAIVADGKGSLTTASAYAVCPHFWVVQNPVKPGLVETAEQSPYGYTNLAKQETRGLKRVCENSRSKPEGGEIRERAREAGAKARHILNRLRPD